MNGLWILILILFLALPIMQIVRQNKSMKRIQEFRSQLQPGMAVETAGGLHGRVVAVKGDVLDLQIAPGVVVEWAVKGILGPVARQESSTATEPTTSGTQGQTTVLNEEATPDHDSTVEPNASEDAVADSHRHSSVQSNGTTDVSSDSSTTDK
ncbi:MULTISPECIES: preprotein translocase subunit YajC [Corynebacterium]|uniref:preprotein translocase subunit YajC n=1 Tax=Corynebacterium TaxID=1716 RepID=UPI00195D22A9|nr:MULTISPECIES: preprotein translocase subunit YajC [Corynebacterium]MDN8623528.1 preprotein translocase subunit YajC [Corynebacterium kroppenstedtii]QRQ64592.1 preprotein translocase subunit YajC [Corynebacterium kroppenstedtii]